MTTQETRSGRGKRVGYFDLLRAAALLRVVTYHTVAWPWLHVAIPAIGVMFALAGSLMAASLERRAALPVIASRIRRVLPPIWVFGIVGLALGWVTLGADGRTWLRLLFWLLPLRDPESHSTGAGFVDILWYVRAYLWFVVLSPVLLRAFRRAPITTLIAPLALLPVAVFGARFGWAGHGAVVDLLGFGSCWILGFAEHDGFLQQLRAQVYGVVFAVLSGAGWLLEFAFPVRGSHDPGPNFIGYALWSAAVVLLLMRWRPDTGWLTRIGWLHRTVTVVNARAVTIYVWHDAAIALTAALVHLMRLHVLPVAELPVVLALTGLLVLAFGWVEDMAAGRRPVLLPAPNPAA